MDFTLLSITLSIITPTNDISFIATSCNCSYRHVNLFNASVVKFDNLNNDC